ncbi:hypothetical protein BD309DRAFT_547621 [Dichomitus squalens]|nr:hypothetical protein BD309DRAFT_547621 [Dichomitus squalens]
MRFLGYIPFAMFSALRAYALSNRSRAIGGIVFILGIAPLVLNYYGDLHHVDEHYDPILGCITNVNVTTATHHLSYFDLHVSHSLRCNRCIPHLARNI